MFGRVEITLKAASGVGIVSSVVMQSDDLDEIDWEWLGADPSQVQSNYFGKGQTNLYNRGAFHADPTSQTQFDTYTIDWTASQIVWQINGQTVRVLTPANANGQYPQTPMQIKIGAWSGGDPANGQGTIAWAGGSTNYAAGPFTMQVKSVTVVDYSKGPLYAYSGTSGAWQDIKTLTAAPVIASMSSQPTPGTQFDTMSTYVTQNIYPATSASMATEYSGLPSGWTVTSSGKVVPPSSAPVSKDLLSSLPFRIACADINFQLTYPVVSFTSSSPVSPLAACSVGESNSGVTVIAVGSEVITQYEQQGFLTVVTVPAGYSTMVKSYDSRGFLITPTSMPACPTNVVATATAVSDGPSSGAQLSTPLAYPQVKGTAMVSSSSVVPTSSGGTRRLGLTDLGSMSAYTLAWLCLALLCRP